MEKNEEVEGFRLEVAVDKKISELRKLSRKIKVRSIAIHQWKHKQETFRW